MQHCAWDLVKCEPGFEKKKKYNQIVLGHLLVVELDFSAFIESTRARTCSIKLARGKNFALIQKQYS